MENPSELLVDTLGHCFLCLDPLDISSVLKQSLNSVTAYLKIDARKLLRFKEVPFYIKIPSSDHFNVNVLLCYECNGLIEKFSEIFKEFEKLDMKLVAILKVVEERTGNRKLEGLTDLREYIKDNCVAVEKMEIAESIRNETLGKCSLKLKGVPNVNVKLPRLTPTKIKSLKEELVVKEVERKSTSCTLCSTKLEDVTLEDHLSSCFVYNGRSVSCKICNLSCTTKSNLQIHYKEVHLKIRNHPCDICLLRFKNPYELNNHRVEVHFPGRRQFTCKKCKLVFNSRWKITKHRRSCYEKDQPSLVTKVKEDAVPVKIEMPQFTEYESVPEIEAILYSEDLKPVLPIEKVSEQEAKSKNVKNVKFNGGECPKCKRTYASNTHARMHYEAVHLKLKRFQCKTCLIKLVSKQSLDNHEILGICQRKEVAIREDKQFKCDQCPQSFTDRSYLGRHKRRLHKNHLRHKCTTCDAKFFEKNKLDRHIRTVHLKERKYHCDLCPEKFSHLQTISIHKARVHSAPMLKCREPCNKEFPIKKSLLLHQKKCVIFNNLEKDELNDIIIKVEPDSTV